MRIQAIMDNYGLDAYKKLHEIAEKKYMEDDTLTGYADMGDHAIVVGVNHHAMHRLSGRFGIGNSRHLMNWFISNLEEPGNELKETIAVAYRSNYVKIGLYTDKLKVGDMFMYVYLYEDYVEISTVVDFLTARNGIYYCDPSALPVWLQDSGNVIRGLKNIPKLRKSSCRKFRKEA